MAKITLDDYTHGVIYPGKDLVRKEDLEELRSNTIKVLKDFYPHHANLDPNKPTNLNVPQEVDSDPINRQHAIATTTKAGFAPWSIYNTLTGLEEQVQELVDKTKYDLYPELSIAIWEGDKASIPNGWVCCDGSVITLDNGEQFITPNLQYAQPVTVTPNRPFKSIHVGLNRYKKSAITGTGNNGDCITELFIIKKPIGKMPKPMVKLTVIQPQGVRIATDYTVNNTEELKALNDGYTTIIDIPKNSNLKVSCFNDRYYTLEKIKVEKNGEVELYNNNSTIIADNDIVVSAVVNDPVVVNIIQPNDCRIIESSSTITEDEARLLPVGDIKQYTISKGESLSFTLYGGIAHSIKGINAPGYTTSLNVLPWEKRTGVVVTPTSSGDITCNVDFVGGGFTILRGAKTGASYTNLNQWLTYEGGWHQKSFRVPDDVNIVGVAFGYVYWGSDENMPANYVGRNAENQVTWYKTKKDSYAMNYVKVTPGSIYTVESNTDTGYHGRGSGRPYGGIFYFSKDFQSKSPDVIDTK